MTIRPLLAGLAVLALAACSAAGTPSPAPSTANAEASSAPEAPKKLTVVSHDSFNLPHELKEKFAKETGYEVVYTPLEDTGSMVNKLILAKDSPLGDVVFGIDNTFASRAESKGIIDPYVSSKLDEQGKSMSTEQLSAIDFGDVCVNADLQWFADNGKELPKTLDDLAKPEYRGLFVTPSPASSSPGLAFLFATVGAKGDGWLDYWKALKDNDVLTVSGWTEAYQNEFTAGEGKGSRPIVLSYATSPAWTVGEDGKPTTVALPDTCFRQVEYAGVIQGAANPEGAKAFVDFLLSDEVQASIPEKMYMYPIKKGVPLPEEWVKFAPLAEKPFEVPSADIDANRESWIQQWTEAIG